MSISYGRHDPRALARRRGPLPPGRWGRAVVVVAVLGGLLLACGPLAAQPQPDDRSRRRDFVEGLLQNLIESQLNRLRPPPPGPPGRRPAPEIRQVQQTLAAFSQESSRLIEALEDDMKRLPGIRPVLGDALQVKAASAVLVEKSARAHDLRWIQEDAQNLDRDWRVLSYRLQQTQELSRPCLQHVDNLNKLDQTLCTLLGIQPQLDRTELIRLTAGLTADLQNLLEEIEIEMPRSPTRDQVVLEGYRARQQARLVSAAIAEPAPYDMVVAEYRRFHNLWTSLAARLRPLPLRRVERNVRRIWQTDREMSELLWIPFSVDRTQLLHLSKILVGDVDDLFDGVSLNMLIDLPAADRVLPTAGEFYGLCEYFLICVEDGQGYPELAGAYRDVEEAWPRFASCFQPLKAGEVPRLLKEIEQAVASLREALGIRPLLDVEMAMQLTALVDNLAEHFEQDVTNHFRQAGGYEKEFQTEVLQTATAFRQTAHHLHEAMTGGNSADHLRRDIAETSQVWDRLYGYVPKFTAEEKAHLQEVAAKLGPALVKLQMLFAL